MKKLILLAALVLTAAFAFADHYSWDFKHSLNNWSSEEGLAWGIKGAELIWEANGPDDGKAVINCYGDPYPSGLDGTLHLFYWNAPFWNASFPGADSGPSARYIVMRYRLIGTAPTSETPHWGKLEFVIDQTKGNTTHTTRAWSTPRLGTTGIHTTGDWSTITIELHSDMAESVERLGVHIGTVSRASHAFFPDADDRIEIDWIKLVDDPSIYSSTRFSEATVEWLGIPGGFKSTVTTDGILRCNFQDPVFSGATYPGIFNDHLILKAHQNWSGKALYLNMRCKVTTLDPSYTQMPATLAYRETSLEDAQDALTTQIVTNEWTTISFPIHETPGWMAGDSWEYSTGDWQLFLGADRATGNPIQQLLGASVEIDWITFGDTPQALPRVPVPDLAHSTQQQGSSDLSGLDLSVGSLSTRRSAAFANGTIIETNPASGTPVETGTVVDIMVSSGPLPELERHIQHAVTVSPAGVLQRDGIAISAIGLNYFDAFSRTLKDPGDTSYDQGFATLESYGIPFVRFMASGFWPVDMNLYFRDKEQYFELMDGVFRSAEQHSIGLVPSLFWLDACVPDLMGEPRNRLGQTDSATMVFMRQYTEEMVLRYKDSPSLWAWEYGNEYNLAIDLPNASEHRPVVAPNLGTLLSRSDQDDIHHQTIVTAFTEFGNIIRAFDATHPVTTGNSIPRPSQHHQRIELSWTQDTRTQFQQNMIDVTADPLDMVSIHHYPAHESTRFDDGIPLTSEILSLSSQVCQANGRALLLGEFGFSLKDYDGNTEAIKQKYLQLIADIKQGGASLAAAWVFDCALFEGTFNITSTNELAYVLESIGRANDTDLDTVSNYDEAQGTFGYVTNPYNADTDGGGIQDGEELSKGMNPLSPIDDRPEDVNNSCTIDLVDIDLMVTALLETDISPWEPDINGDTAIDAADLQLVINATTQPLEY